ncbi:acetylcholine receptor subunit beta-like [Saccostrea echinata]|uniref:acetylcholine receptor subunit beta-like n=1 Tax=Saccostrea echinata TaxID=191078 RepID=UPI002A7ED3A5|nr:acetylcholine receptor subunit beta-like [Saccostrea echinata]
MDVLILVLPLVFCVEGYTITQQTQLHTNLATGYDRRVRPGENRTVPLQIKFNFYLASLKEFSEAESKIGIVGSLGLEWIDSRLSWNPSGYGGDLYETTLFTSDMWVPFLVLMNPFAKLKKVLLDEMSCKVTDGGYVNCLPPDLYEATCDADVTYYPFDSQTCTLKFYVPGFSPTDILLRPAISTFRMDLYEENGLWSITSTRLYYQLNVFNFEELRLEINMKRRTTYYIAGLILPICLMNFIQILVFILPVESGERMGFSITVLLAVAVFLTIIQDKLPEASEPSVANLTYKLLVDMLLGCSMVIAVVIGLKFYHETEDREIPARLKNFTRSMKFCCKRRKAKVTVKKYDGSEKPPIECVDDTADIDITWNDVGLAFDKLFFIVFFVSLVSNNIVYLTTMAVISS